MKAQHDLEGEAKPSLMLSAMPSHEQGAPDRKASSVE